MELVKKIDIHCHTISSRGIPRKYNGNTFCLPEELIEMYKIIGIEKAVISPAERETERIMLSLRTARGLDISTLPKTVDALFSSLASHGLCRKAGDTWTLTPRGFLVSNAIIGETLSLVE